ncbi:MAG: DUF2585 family protein [Acidobacteria bacterium]|nr:DUF2585 family protein [Acidobacteriota bacterium]
MKIIPKTEKPLIQTDSWKYRLPWIFMFSAILLMMIALAAQGRIWWCKWDTPLYIWSSDVWSKHNSQHFFDPYFFTHILHGFLFFWLARLIFRRRIAFAWMLLVAVVGESLWEVLENSSYVITLYRANTASLEYTGDSIANSIGDVTACIVGFLIAYKLRVWRSIIVFLIVEIVLVLTIKDSLLINIIMLIHPIEAIKVWQTSGIG